MVPRPRLLMLLCMRCQLGLAGLQRGPAEPVAQVRQALGADGFDQLFAAGSRLNQRNAVAAVRDQRRAGAAFPPRKHLPSEKGR